MLRKALCELQIMCSNISTDISVVVLVLGKKEHNFMRLSLSSLFLF